MNTDDVTRALGRALRGETLTVAELIDLRLAVRNLPISEVHNALTAAIESAAARQFGETL